MARSRTPVPKRKPRAKSKTKVPQKRQRSVSQQALAMSVDQFCDAHNISRDLFYELMRLGQGPQCMKLKKRRLISFEAAAAWRAARGETEVAA